MKFFRYKTAGKGDALQTNYSTLQKYSCSLNFNVLY